MHCEIFNRGDDLHRCSVDVEGGGVGGADLQSVVKVGVKE